MFYVDGVKLENRTIQLVIMMWVLATVPNLVCENDIVAKTKMWVVLCS